LIHATLAPGAEVRLPWRKDYNALVYAMAGSGFAGDEQRPLQMGQLAVFGEGDSIVVRAANQQESRSPNLELFILGGQPIKEPVAWMGPFVMNTKREVMDAFEDFQKGLLGSIPAIYKEDAKPKQPLNRTDKLGGEAKPASANEILDVHNAPTEMQEGN
jgi:redox-sensitive bicupin YhaK (pirin superfamily)